jgi:hypothetical protein
LHRWWYRETATSSLDLIPHDIIIDRRARAVDVLSPHLMDLEFYTAPKEQVVALSQGKGNKGCVLDERCVMKYAEWMEMM